MKSLRYKRIKKSVGIKISNAFLEICRKPRAFRMNCPGFFRVIVSLSVYCFFNKII